MSLLLNQICISSTTQKLSTTRAFKWQRGQQKSTNVNKLLDHGNEAREIHTNLKSSRKARIEDELMSTYAPSNTINSNNSLHSWFQQHINAKSTYKTLFYKSLFIIVLEGQDYEDKYLLIAFKNQGYEKWKEHSGENIFVIINRNAPLFIMICNHSCICSSVKKRIQSWLRFELGNTTSFLVLWVLYDEIKTFVEGKLLL